MWSQTTLQFFSNEKNSTTGRSWFFMPISLSTSLKIPSWFNSHVKIGVVLKVVWNILSLWLFWFWLRAIFWISFQVVDVTWSISVLIPRFGQLEVPVSNKSKSYRKSLTEFPQSLAMRSICCIWDKTEKFELSIASVCLQRMRVNLTAYTYD